MYRHPGNNTEYIDRVGEAHSMQVAKELGIDRTFFYMEPHEGWKISLYKVGAYSLDYQEEHQVKEALALMKKLHDAKVSVDYEFNIWAKALGFLESISAKNKADFTNFDILFNRMEKIALDLEKDGVPHCLCHCDTLPANFIIHADGMDLIDWEYSGMGDPATDLATFICSSPTYTYEDALRIFEMYYGRPLRPEELRHCVGYVAITSFCWLLWAIFQEGKGNFVGSYLYLWHKCAKLYGDKALALYA